jgi:hypothetical protein
MMMKTLLINIGLQPGVIETPGQKPFQRFFAVRGEAVKTAESLTPHVTGLKPDANEMVSRFAGQN